MIAILSIILASGTGTAYAQPQLVQEQQQLTQNILPAGGKCLGLQTSPTYCKFIQMPDGSMILNTHWTENAFTISADVLYAGDPYVGSTLPGPTKEDTQTVTVEEDYDNGGSDEDTVGDANEGDKTYCDVPNPSNPCHDRKDYSDTTGLYRCIRWFT
jgi:hypothetical protein